MKKSLMGILLVIAIAVSACGVAQPQTAPVNDTAAEAPASEPAREEISLEVVPDESTVGDKMTEDEMSADETMMEEETPVDDMAMEEETSADEMMEEETSADEMMEEEASSHELVDEVEEAAGEAMIEEEASDETMAEPVQEEMFGPDWFNVELADVNTGETFKVSDFQGKVILIETMAVWCPICTQQQQQIRALHGQLGERDDFVSLSLDIDPNESHDILKSHVDRNGFSWSYAVAPPEVSHEIGDLYGRSFLNPPAAPMFVIDRQGEAHLLPFGVKSAAELQDAVTPFLNEG